MRGKLLFITGGLAGYVLGARAGRKRYEQIASAANELWNAKPVQRRVTEVRDFALEAVGDVPSALIDAGKKVVGAVQARKQKTDAAQSRSRATAPHTTPAGATPDLADPTE
jgi:hypothetical protein